MNVTFLNAAKRDYVSKGESDFTHHSNTNGARPQAKYHSEIGFEKKLDSNPNNEAKTRKEKWKSRLSSLSSVNFFKTNEEGNRTLS